MVYESTVSLMLYVTVVNAVGISCCSFVPLENILDIVSITQTIMISAALRNMKPMADNYLPVCP